MARKMVVHFVCEVTHIKTDHKFQRGVTVEFPSNDILEEEDGFDFVVLNGGLEGAKKIAALQQGAVSDYNSRVIAFQIMP